MYCETQTHSRTYYGDKIGMTLKGIELTRDVVAMDEMNLRSADYIEIDYARVAHVNYLGTYPESSNINITSLGSLWSSS